MIPRRILPALLFCAFLGLPIVTAQRCFAAWPHDPRVNVPVCITGFDKANVVACSDAAGGIILAWEDGRSGVHRIYAQRILPDGTPAWTPNGVQLVTFSTVRAQNNPVICSDGAGGAIVAWTEIWSVSDEDIYAQHVAADGSQAWGTNGIGVCTLGDFQASSTIAADGLGGALIAWHDRRSGTNYDIYAQHLTGGGALAAGSWVSQGLAVCNFGLDQVAPVMAADGAGGFDVVWRDSRGPSPTGLYAQRFTASGSVATGWTVNGIQLQSGGWTFNEWKVVTNASGGGIYVWSDQSSGNVDVYCVSLSGTGVRMGPYYETLCSAAGSQTGLAVTPDDAGGAFVAWEDNRSGADIYAQRVTGNGTIAAGWPVASSALPVCTAVNSQNSAAVVADGAGGALIAWADLRTGSRSDVYATHLTANGSVADGWLADGTPICTADMSQTSIRIVPDGASGAVLGWHDFRNGIISYTDLYAQRVERFGRLGSPEPGIVKVRDVPNDQGGKVRVSWNASYVDAYPDYGVTSYWLWRQVPASSALAALRAGARIVSADEDLSATRERAFRAPSSASATWYWEYVSSQIANGFPTYSVVTPTQADSVTASNPRTVFMIEARTYGSVRWDSAPDSGYSVDNLGPAMPAPFTGAYGSGATHLHWGLNHEADLAGYRLYRGTSAGFVPGPGNRIAAQPDTGYADAGAAGSYYKLSAVDIHGNESPFALLSPSGTLQVGDAGVLLSFSGAAPNPVKEDAIIRWTLPRAEPARLEILDPAGRLVRRLVEGLQTAGPHETHWDARDGAGRTVRSGLYFIRFEAEGRTMTSRVAAIL